MCWCRRGTCAGVLIVAIAAASLVGAAAGDDAEGGKWIVPTREAQKANPHPNDAQSQAAGKKIYSRECSDCHGERGKGDGPGARDLSERPPDLSSEAVQKQSDGALFYKITRGRGEMPSYRKMLRDDQRWHVVNFMRTLGPGEN